VLHWLLANQAVLAKGGRTRDVWNLKAMLPAQGRYSLAHV
jgi:hypothetical protein